MAVTVTKQSAGAIFRQVLAVLGLVFSALTQAEPSIKLPPVASGVLGLLGIVILGLEHYVADPSTGSTNAQPAVVVRAGPPPPVAVPVTQNAGAVGPPTVAPTVAAA